MCICSNLLSYFLEGCLTLEHPSFEIALPFFTQESRTRQIDFLSTSGSKKQDFLKCSEHICCHLPLKMTNLDQKHTQAFDKVS